MGELEYLVGCKINRYINKINLNIYQQYIINKITQVFNEDVKSIITCNTPSTPYNGDCV